MASSSRSSRRFLLVGGSQDTTVVPPSHDVDLYRGPEVVAFSDGSIVAEEDEEESSPGSEGLRVSGRTQREGVLELLFLPVLVTSLPTPKLWMLIQTETMFLKGQLPADEEVEVPVGEMDVERDICAERLFDEVIPAIPVSVLQGGSEGGARGNLGSCFQKE